FNAAHVMTAKVSLPKTQYSAPERRNNFFRQLLQRLTATPGVESAAVTSGLPLWDEGISGSGFYVEGRPEPKYLSEIPIALHCAVSPGYFHTMGMRLIRGRDFNDGDVEGKEKVVIVDETIARRIFAGDDSIGRRIRFGGPQFGPQWLTILRVAPAIRNYGLKKDAGMQAYLPYQQASGGNMAIVARAPGDPASLTATMRDEVAALDKDLPLFDARPMAEVVAIAIWDDKYLGILFGLFAALALCLAAVGIYGVVSYSVAQRTSEIGVRMALGAQTGDVMRMIIRQGLTLAALGAAVGLGGAALATRLMKSL